MAVQIERPGEYLIPGELAQEIGMSRETVIDAMRRGKLRAVKMGTGTSATYLIHREDADAYKADRRARDEEALRNLQLRLVGGGAS